MINDPHRSLFDEPDPEGVRIPLDEPSFISGVHVGRGFNYRRSLRQMARKHVRIFYLCAFMGMALFALCMGVEHFKEKQMLDEHYLYECTEGAQVAALYEKERLLGVQSDLETLSGQTTEDLKSLEEAVRLATSTDGCAMGVVGLDGDLVTGSYLDMRIYHEIYKSFNGSGYISFHKGLGLLFTTPVYFDARVRYVMYKVVSEEDLKNIKAFNAMGSGATMVRDSNWNVVIDSEQKGAASMMLSQSFLNVYHDLPKERTLDGAAASSLIFEDGKLYYVYNSPIADTGLFLTGYVSADELGEQFATFFKLQHLTYGLIFVVVILMLLVFRGLGGSLVEESRALSRQRILQISGEVRRRAFEYMANELSPHMQDVSTLGEHIGSQATNSEIRSMSNSVKNSANKVLHALDNIVKLSKLERGTLRLKEVEYELAPMLKKIIVENGAKAQAKKLQFKVEVSPRLPEKLYGDRKRIAEVIDNLLDNAVKFTRNGQVMMQVSGEFSNDGKRVMLRIKVSDTGCGMSESMRKRIFRELPKREQEKGRRMAGFGLALSYSYLKLMAGYIDVQSVEGHGSTLTVGVPQDVRSRKTLATIMAKKAAPKPKEEEKPETEKTDTPETKETKPKSEGDKPKIRPFNNFYVPEEDSAPEPEKPIKQPQWYKDPLNYHGPKVGETLDVDAALGNFHEDMKEFLGECETFIRISAERLDKLKQAERGGNWKYYVLLMGSLRKTAEDLGGGKLFRAAAALENAARTQTQGWRGDPELRKAGADYVLKHHDECMQLYEEFLKAMHSSLNI